MRTLTLHLSTSNLKMALDLRGCVVVLKVNLPIMSSLNSVYIDFIAVSFERKMQGKIRLCVGNKLTDR